MTIEVGFAQHIRPLFRERDVTCMKRAANFDLTNYNDVKLWSQTIYDELESKSMPKDGAFWSESQLSLFKRWMESGMNP